jgi:hypothetical protein
MAPLAAVVGGVAAVEVADAAEGEFDGRAFVVLVEGLPLVPPHPARTAANASAAR